MNTAKLIKELEKIAYVASLRQLKDREINQIKIAVHRLQNYEKATAMFMKAKSRK